MSPFCGQRSVALLPKAIAEENSFSCTSCSIWCAACAGVAGRVCATQKIAVASSMANAPHRNKDNFRCIWSRKRKSRHKKSVYRNRNRSPSSGWFARGRAKNHKSLPAGCPVFFWTRSGLRLIRSTPKNSLEFDQAALHIFFLVVVVSGEANCLQAGSADDAKFWQGT